MQKKLTIICTLRNCVPLAPQTGKIMYKLKPESRRLKQIISSGVGINNGKKKIQYIYIILNIFCVVL